MDTIKHLKKKQNTKQYMLLKLNKSYNNNIKNYNN